MGKSTRRITLTAACAALIAWPAQAAEFVPTASLPQGYMGHTLVEAGGRLYHMGGLGSVDGVFAADDVLYATIVSQGKLDAWTAAPSLPEPTFFHASVAWGSHIYVIGGQKFDRGMRLSSDVLYSALDGSGVPGAWQAAASLPEPLFMHSAAVWDGTIFVTGGWGPAGLSDRVYKADILPDGALSPWTSLASLPEAVYTHATVQDGTLYVLAGVINGGSQIHNGVFYSRIKPDKTLEPWTATTPLPTPLSNHAASVVGGKVVLSGGWTGSVPVAAVHSAAILSDKTLDAWTDEASLPAPLYLHASAAAGERIFVSGGSDGSTYQSAVYSLRIEPAQTGPEDSLPPRTELAVGAPKFGTAPLLVTPGTPLSLSAVDDAVAPGDGVGIGVETTFRAMDEEDFVAYSGPFTAGSDGLRWLRWFSVDSAGNSEQVRSLALAVDGTPPVSEVTVGTPKALLDSGEVFVSPLTEFRVSSVDPLSAGAAAGVAQTRVGLDGAPPAPASGAFTLPASDGPHEIATQGVDNLGNTEEVRKVRFLLDGTAPETTLSAVPAPYQPPAGAPFLRGDALLSFTASDPETGGVASGIHHTEVSVDGSPAQEFSTELALDEGTRTVSFWSIDNVGNAEEHQSAEFRVDATPPLSMLTAGSPSEGTFGVFFVAPDTPVTIESEDPASEGTTSGLKRILYSLDGGPEQEYAAPLLLPAGNHTISFSAEDNAGNRETPRTQGFYCGSLLADRVIGSKAVTLSGGAQGLGPVRSDGAFQAKGGAVLDGDVVAASVQVTGKKSGVTGSTTEAPATIGETPDLAAARTAAQASNSNASIPAALLQAGALELSGTDSLTLDAGDYYLTGLQLSGKAALSVSGRVNIFVAGPVQVSGQAELHAAGSPEDLWILADDDVSISGQGRMALHLLAPDAAVSVSGNGQLAGRIFGRTVSINGSAQQSFALQPRTIGKGRAKKSKVAKGDPKGGKQTRTGADSGSGPAEVVSSELGVQAAQERPADADPKTGELPAAPEKAPPSVGKKGPRPVLVESPNDMPLPSVEVSSKAAFGLVNRKGGQVRSRTRSGVDIPSEATSGTPIFVDTEDDGSAAEKTRRETDRLKKGIFAAGPPIKFGPEGTTFSKPVTLELEYDPADLPAGIPEDELQVHYWNEGEGVWQALPSTVDKTERVVRAQTTHFSLYQVFAGGEPAASPNIPGLSFGAVYAFPNPAKRGVSPTLHVEADQATKLDIRIYDISGEQVHGASLTGPAPSIDDGSGRGPVPAFEYSWDVSGVGSGVYIYVLRAQMEGAGSIRTRGKLAVIK